MWANNVGAMSTLAAFSMSNVLHLRVLAIVGQLCGIFFCATRDPPLWNPVAWQAVFLAVNAANLADALRDEALHSVRLRPRELDVYERVFLPHGVTLRQYRRLLACAVWRSVGPGHVVTMWGGFAAALTLSRNPNPGHVVTMWGGFAAAH
jgi:hypothetical protein